MNEASYTAGRLSVFSDLARQCAVELGVDTAQGRYLLWGSERARLVVALRSLCDEYGDNDWPDDLNLVDVIEKHLVGRLIPLIRDSAR